MVWVKLGLSRIVYEKTNWNRALCNVHYPSFAVPPQVQIGPLLSLGYPPRSKRIDRATLAGLGNHKNGHEWGRHGSPRAHIKPGRSHHLQDAF